MSLLILVFLSLGSHASPNFSFHLAQEPMTLNPARVSGVSLDYFYSNLYEGLYTFDEEKGLVTVGAEEPCEYKKETLVCKLAKVLWSDGTPVTAEHYVQAFRYMIDPNNKSREAGLLLSLKNAKEILEGSKKPEELGIIAVTPNELNFIFEKTDYDFIAKLAAPILTPWKVLPDKKNSITNGPYKIKDWIKGKRIFLERNPHYRIQNKNSPNVEIFFFSEDMTAVNFFDLKKMTFLRRLPTDLEATYKKKPGYFENTVATLDYIGFGPQLADKPELRKALSLGLDFENFKILFHSLKRPGCSGIPQKMIHDDHCLNFSLKEAKEALEKFKKSGKEIKLFYMYAMSGDDIRRIAEWVQNQWKKNLGLTVEVRTEEQRVYTSTLTHSPPPIFKKILYLDRPSCLSAFEQFHSKNPNNYIQLKNPEYDALIEKIQASKNQDQQKRLCADALKFLIDGYWIIPQGGYYLSGIANPRFKGWKLNSMNQFDLSHLIYE